MWRPGKPAGRRNAFLGLDQPPHYVSPSLTCVYGREYTFKAAGQVSVLTLAGRLVLPYQGWSRHLAWLQHGAQVGGANLWYDRGRKRFSLLVSLAIQTPDPTPATPSQVVGVDLGPRYLATVTTPNNQTHFCSGKQARATADLCTRVQKRLQRKGTWPPTRRRIATQQRERWFKLSRNLVISKQIVETYSPSLIGLEDLPHIRERTKRKHGKKATKMQRRANRHASRWAFAELRGLLVYKATRAASCCVSVDADCTSQTCPRCGHTSKQNRPMQGLLFCCGVCHDTLHADLIGARNICLRTLAIRCDW